MIRVSVVARRAFQNLWDKLVVLRTCLTNLPWNFSNYSSRVIVEQTNLFAQQYLDSHELPPLSRARQWNKSSHMVAELKRFCAAVIVMALIDYPCVEDCWVTSWPYSTTTFRSILTCDRFSLIMKFFHLNDSSRYIPKRQPGYDPLYKLRPFMDVTTLDVKFPWMNP